VEGLKPPDTEWYECKCGDKLLVRIIASYPRDYEVEEAKKRGIEITQNFIARDRTEWGSLAQAKNHNKLLDEIAEIESFLLPRTQELEQGYGYIQQDPNQVEQVKHRLRGLLEKKFGTPNTDKSMRETVIAALEYLHPGIPKSIIEKDPIYKFYVRLTAIDSEGREWQNARIAQGVQKDPKFGKHVRLEVPALGSKEGSNDRREGRGPKQLPPGKNRG